MDVLRSCEYALQLERESRDYFTENAARLSHAAAASVYRSLAEEADKHIKFIKGVTKARRGGTLERLPRATADAQGKLGWRSLAEIMDDEVAQELRPDVAILRLGLVLQHDLVTYYAETAEGLEGAEHDAFSRLAGWVQTMEGLLQQMYDRVFALYAA